MSWKSLSERRYSDELKYPLSVFPTVIALIWSRMHREDCHIPFVAEWTAGNVLITNIYAYSFLTTNYNGWLHMFVIMWQLCLACCHLGEGAMSRYTGDGGDFLSQSLPANSLLKGIQAGWEALWWRGSCNNKRGDQGEKGEMWRLL